MEPEGSFRVHSSPQLVAILSQINSVNITLSCLSKIYFNIVTDLSTAARQQLCKQSDTRGHK
jgi:hypothetical protein